MNEPTCALTLAKGQVWTMANQQMKIYRAGKYLVEFRLFKLPMEEKQRLATLGRLESVEQVHLFLIKNNAVLQG